MDLTMVFNLLFAMMVVPCVALLVYGAWLSWCESAYKVEDERTYGRRSATSRESGIAANSPRPGPALRRTAFSAGATRKLRAARSPLGGYPLILK